MCYNNTMTKTNKLIFDKALNDMPYGWTRHSHHNDILGKRYRSMIRRTLPDWQKTHCTYEGVDVCDEWLTMSSFVTWAESKDWQGKELDKDILCPGNKIYSPDTCVFVSRKLNGLLCGSDAIRGDCPKGVYYYSRLDKYAAMIKIDGKKKWVGRYPTKLEAHRAYCNAKAAHIREIAENLTDKDTTDVERTRAGLLKHAVIEENAWRETADSMDSVPTLFG